VGDEEQPAGRVRARHRRHHVAHVRQRRRPGAATERACLRAGRVLHLHPQSEPLQGVGQVLAHPVVGGAAGHMRPGADDRDVPVRPLRAELAGRRVGRDRVRRGQAEHAGGADRHQAHGGGEPGQPPGRRSGQGAVRRRHEREAGRWCRRSGRGRRRRRRRRRRRSHGVSRGSGSGVGNILPVPTGSAASLTGPRGLACPYDVRPAGRQLPVRALPVVPRLALRHDQRTTDEEIEIKLHHPEPGGRR
jgi:hypothetical protein